MANASTVGALRVVLGIDTAAFTGGLTKAQAHLKKAGGQMQKTGRELRTIGLALNAAVVGAATAAGVAVLKLSDQIIDLAAEAKTAGVAFKEFQALKFAADRNQVSLAALTDGMKELQLRADEFVKTGKGSSAEAFQRLGFTASDLSKRLKDPSALFEEIIRRLGQVDKAAQIRISDEIFGGTGGEQFVRFLDDGVDGIRRLKAEFANSGNLITPEQVQRAEDLKNAVRRLQEAVSNVARAFIDTGITEWLTGVATKVANFASSVVQAVPGLVKWGAVIGVAAVAIGGLLVVVGSVVSSIGAILPVFGALAAAVSQAGGAMALLKGAMAFLLGNIWVAAILAVVAAVGFFVLKSQEATAVQKQLKASTDQLDEATRQYEDAVRLASTAQGKEKESALELVKAKRQLLQDTIALTKAKLAEARAEAVLMATRAKDFAEAQRQTISRSARGDIGESGARGGVGLVSAQLEGGARRAEAAAQAAQASVDAAQNSFDNFMKTLNAPVDLPYFRDLSPGPDANKDKSSGRTQAELAFARETLKLQAELEGAKLRADQGEVRRLEDIIDRRSRIEAYESQELTNAAAQVAADRDRALIARAREEAQKKALADRADDLTLQVAQIDGDQKIVDLMERKRDLAQLVAAYEADGAVKVEAERMARADLLKIEEARLRLRQRLLQEASQEHAIRLAELSGNDRMLKQLRDAKEIEDRSRRYRTEGGEDGGDAYGRAQREVMTERAAATYGEHRDMFSSAFSDGLRAAMAGDLKGFLSNQFGEFMSLAFKRAGEQVFDRLMGGFDATAEGTAQGVAQGAAAAPAMIGAGATVAATIATAMTAAGSAAAAAMASAMATASAVSGGSNAIGTASNLLAMLPKFSTGAMIPPSGSSGIDSQLVAFWKSPRERVSVLNPDQAIGGGRGGTSYHISGNLLTPEFWSQIKGEVAAGEARAYGRAMNDAPKLTMSQTARQQRQAVGRQRRGS